MGCSLGHRLDSNPRMFRVYNVDKNGEARTMGRIEITEEDLILHQKGKEAVCWPLRSLRRYGFDAELFSFESGRRCPTGQGIYAFKCQRAEALFNLLQECIQLAGEQQQQQQHPPVEHNPSVSPRPPPQLEAWPPDSQLPTYVNREVIVAAANIEPSQQHQYVNTGTLNGGQQQTQASPVTTHTNGPITTQVNYAQLDLEGGDAAATYVNVCAADNGRRPSPSHLAPLPTPQVVEANTVVPPPDLCATTPPGDNGDIQYIQVEIVNDSAPASPAATAVETYTFPPNTAAAESNNPPSTTPATRDDKYAVIDFDKTYAINAKSNHDNEGSRKTRHNSNLEDCA